MQRRTFIASAALSAIAARPGPPAFAGPPGPVAFTIEFRVRPGREVDFRALLDPLLDAMRHEATFLGATLHQDQEDPSRFLLHETWADLDDVRDVQLHRPYRRAYNDALPALLAAERTIGIWRPLRSDPPPGRAS